MADPRIPLKNPYLAAALGLLFPGGGHLYQGRIFKGTLYAVCIVGTFTYGMFLSQWTALYAGNSTPKSIVPQRWGFIAQVPIGLPAVYAVFQKNRYQNPANLQQNWLNEPLSDAFSGVMVVPGTEQEERKIGGRLELHPVMTALGPDVEGTFQGSYLQWNAEAELWEESNQPVELQLGHGFEIDREIYADENRLLKINVVEEADGQRRSVGYVLGTIPRPLADRFAVPLEEEKLQRLHGELGKTYDLALVYTWIAALLNVLVIWDAFEGPAYGYGDESPEDDPKAPDQKTPKPPANPSPEPAPADKPAS